MVFLEYIYEKDFRDCFKRKIFRLLFVAIYFLNFTIEYFKILLNDKGINSISKKLKFFKERNIRKKYKTDEETFILHSFFMSTEILKNIYFKQNI